MCGRKYRHKDVKYNATLIVRIGVVNSRDHLKICL